MGCAAEAALNVAIAVAWPLPAGSIRSAAVALGLSHGLLGFLAWRRHPAFERAWRAHAVGAAAWGGLMAWHLLVVLATVHGLRGDWPQGLTLALTLAAVVVGMASLPVAAWGLARWHRASDRRLPRWGAVALVGLAALRLVQWHDAARGSERPGASDAFLATVSTGWPFEGLPLAPRERTARSWPLHSIACRTPIEEGATAFVTFVSRDPDAEPLRIDCLQAPTPEEVARRTLVHLDEHAADGPLWVDLIIETTSVPAVDGFQLVESRDGVCSTVACLLPWQLAARNVFDHRELLGGLLRVDSSPPERDLVAMLEPRRQGSLETALRRFSTRRWSATSMAGPLVSGGEPPVSRPRRRGTR